jgi:hypothetical protein
MENDTSVDQPNNPNWKIPIRFLFNPFPRDVRDILPEIVLINDKKL